jgi:hypothetical protein
MQSQLIKGLQNELLLALSPLRMPGSKNTKGKLLSSRSPAYAWISWLMFMALRKHTQSGITEAQKISLSSTLSLLTSV